MTVSESAHIVGNFFHDNSGSAIVLGGGAGMQVEDNAISQQQVQAWAGIQLDTIHGPHSSQFYGAVFRRNHIQCRGKCYFGIAIGPNPFASGADPVVGGDVHNNTVEGAIVGINVDAATSWQLYDNIFGRVQGHFDQCHQPATELNISPTSQVDRHSQTKPAATKLTYAGCVQP